MWVEQGQLVQAMLEGVQAPRQPTPGYEYGLLGLGNSRCRDLDPRTLGPLAMWRSVMHSFGAWVTGPWLLGVQQETYRQYNGPVRTPWQR